MTFHIAVDLEPKYNRRGIISPEEKFTYYITNVISKMNENAGNIQTIKNDLRMILSEAAYFKISNI